MRRSLFWLSDQQWERIEPRLPTDVRGVERADDRRVISGIVHVLKSGCRWCDCPPEYGPATTIYNRFVRWAQRGIWENLCWQRAIYRHADDRFHARESAPLGSRRKRGEQKQAVGRSRGGRNTKIHALADAKGRLLAILLTGGEAHDCPIAERLIRRVKRPKRMLGDKAYDSAELRQELDERGTKPVIPNRCNRKQPFSFSKRLYKLRWRIENAFNRLKDFRRIATRYDRLARNYLASVCLVAALVWWIWYVPDPSTLEAGRMRSTLPGGAGWHRADFAEARTPPSAQLVPLPVRQPSFCYPVRCPELSSPSSSLRRKMTARPGRRLFHKAE